MAASAMTPKLLDYISNEEYQEKDKWKIDDIALGPANELLISGHNLETPKTFISMYKEKSGKYDNRPEFNKTFDKTQPGEQLALFVKGSSIIGLEDESALQLFKIEDMGVFRTISWNWSLNCVCFYRGKLYAALSSRNIVSVCNFDSEEKSDIIFNDMKNDCVLEMVVVMEKIYICTKNAGQALVFSMTGSKKMEFENAIRTDAKATSICIHERTELVFVLWNNIQIQLYSQNTSPCLCSMDMTEQLHKIRVTTENILVTSSASKCIVTVYDVGEAICFGEFQNNILSSVKKKHRKKLMSHDEENLECHPADFETLSTNWKSATKQSKVEKLRDTKELYKKQLEEKEIRRRKYDTDIQEARTESDDLRRTNEEKEEKCVSLTKQLEAERKTTEELKDEIERSKKEKNDLTEELENTRSKLTTKEADLSDVKATLDDTRNESDELRIMNEEKEVKCCSLTKQLEAERKATGELKHEIDRSRKEKDDVTEELENTRSNLSRKEADLSDVKVKLDDARTDNDDLRRMIEEKEKIFGSLKKRLETGRKTTEEGDITKDIYADSTENMETGLKNLIDGINDDTVKLKKKVEDVTRELKSTNLTLKKKEEDCSQIQDELDAAISEKKELEKAATETDTLKQMIEVKDKEIQQLQMRLQKAEKDLKNTETQVTLLRDRKNELVESVSKEQNRSEELQALLANLEDANNRLKIEHDKAEKKETLLSNIFENLDRDALTLKTESEIVKEILQTKGKQNDMLVCLQLHFNSRTGILKKEADILENMMGQQIKTIDFEKKNRRALPNMLEQSSTYKDKQEVTATGLQHKSLPDNPDTLDKETKTLITKLTGPITQTSNPEKQEMIGKGPTEEKIHLGATRLPEVEQMLATGKEGVTQMTSLQAGKPLRLEQIQDFKVTKEERQLTMIESQLQGVRDKVTYETLQYKYFRDKFEALSGSDEYTKTTAQLDANTGFKIKYDKAENTLFFDILDNLERDAFISETENEILQTEANKNTPIVRLQSEFNSRTGILRKEAELLDYMMEQQKKTIDFEKKNRRALPNMLEQSSTDKDKQEVTAMGLQHKSLPHNPDTLDKEIHLGATRLPEVEQMLATGKEGVTQMTSLQAGKPLRLEQIQDFKVTKEERQLTMIESQLQGVRDKVTYETLQYEYFRDMLESTTKLQEFLQKSTLLNRIDALVKKISNCKDKLTELKENQDNTVKESEVQINWFELSELQVSLVVSQDGGKLKIPGSDVSLDIPPGALREQREIQMKIIPHCLDPGGDPLSFSSNSSVVVELLPNNLQFLRTVHLRLPHCLHLNDNYNSLQDVEVLISHHEKGDTPKWDISTDTACTLQKDHCVIPLKQFCWITYRVDDKVVTAKRLKIFTAGRDLELSDRESEVEVGYFPDLPGSGEILRNNPKLSRGQIKPFLFQKNEEESTLLISLQQVIPTEWQNNIELGDQQTISYQSICTGTEISCPFHLQYTPEGSPSGKVPLCRFKVTQRNAEQINITFRPEVKCKED